MEGLTTNPYFWEENQKLLNSDKLAQSMISTVAQINLNALSINDLTILDQNLSDERVKALDHPKLNKLAAQVHDQLFQISKDEEPVVIEIMSDIDYDDHNSSILDRFNSSIESEHITITTRSLFRGARDEEVKQHEKDVLPTIDHLYDIYSRGSFLVFVPKKLGKVENLDLNPSALKRIELGEAWKQTEEKHDIQCLNEIFTDQPQRDKLIYIAGHGGVGTPGGMYAEHYKEFLQWAEAQKCKGLLVTSCYSGGESTLLYQTPFPVLVRSIGDFVTHGQQSAEEDPRLFFSKMSQLLKTPGGLTVKRIKKMVQGVEAGKKKSFNNLLQVYFPHSAESPVGFRPVGEGGESSNVTFTRYRKEEIEKGHLLISNKTYVELHPGYIECPIVFEGSDGQFLSMIPGAAHHLLAQVTLAEMTPLDYLKKSADFFNSSDFRTPKTLFFSSLTGKGEKLDQVFINLTTGERGYRNGERYFLWYKDQEPVEVSPLRYLLRWHATKSCSTPKADAIRSATGGQQGVREVENHLVQPEFWADQQEVYDKYKVLLHDMPTDMLLAQVSEWNLTKQDTASIVHHLLSSNREEAACALYQTLPCDSRGENGSPLIIAAARAKCVKFIKLVMENKGDLNLTDSAGKDCLTAGLKCPELVDLLLSKDSTFNLEAKNPKGNLFYFNAALENSETLKKILEKKLPLNVKVNYKGKTRTLLDYAVYFEPLEQVRLLLASGADPNYVDNYHSPLSIAIIRGDREKIALLLQYGANPFKKDPNGQYPICQAMKRSPFSVVEDLFQSFDKCTQNMPEEKKKELLTEILFEAILSGEEEKIDLVLDHNASYPDTLDFETREDMIRGVVRLLLFGNRDFFKEMDQRYQLSKNDAADLTKGLSPDLLISILDETWDLSAVIETASVLKNIDEPSRQKIISKALQLGANIKGSKYVTQAASKGNYACARFLIEQGADVDHEIANYGDIDLIKFVWQRAKPPLLLWQLTDSDVKSEKKELYKWLIEQGADVNTVYNDTTPLRHIVIKDDKKMYDLFMEHASKETSLENLAKAALGGWSKEKEEIVKDLILRGADVNSFFPAVVEFGSLDLVKWCVDKGAIIKNGALFEAALQKEATFKYLVENGADIKQIPMIKVIQNGDLELLKYCLGLGVSDLKKEIKMALFSAIESGKPEVLDLVVQLGSPLSLADWEEAEASSLLINAYKKGMLEKVLELAPLRGAIEKAGLALERDIIYHGDLNGLKF